jgi:2-keto-4-pentenoate hydratase
MNRAMTSVSYVDPPDVTENVTVHDRRRRRPAARDGWTWGSSWRGGGDSSQPLGLTAPEHRRLADVLLNAARDRRSVAPLSERYPELTIGDACRIRDALLARRTAGGEQLIGATVSFGTPSAERRVSVADPRLGWLTDAMLLPGAVVDLGPLIRPRIEPKVAFRLGRPLRAPLSTASDLLTASEHVFPCLEVLDSRYGRDGTALADDIADNCAAAGLVIGEKTAPPPEGHLRRLRVRLQLDGADAEPGRARGALVVSPLDVATWLANQLIRRGLELRPGTLLVCPAGSSALVLAPGVRVSAHFRRLGSIEIRTIFQLAHERAPAR